MSFELRFDGISLPYENDHLCLGRELAYFKPKGILFELKACLETAAVNGVKGLRSTLRAAVPLNWAAGF